MDTEDTPRNTGHELGHEGVDRMVGQVEGFCTHERRRIELANQPKILGLRAELAVWDDRERALEARLRQAPPPGDRRSRRRRARYAGGIALLLTLAGFFFSLLAFDPFRFGWKSYLYCAGIAVVSPFLVEKLLEEWASHKLMKSLVTLACTAAIVSLVLLAVIRGDLFAAQMKDSETPVLVTGDTPAAPQDGNRFYGETLPLLRLVMAFLAVAMELGAGLALHDARRLGADSGEDSEKLSKELVELRLRMAAILAEICAREQEAAVFEARFWRDFYRAMLTHTARKALTKLLTAMLCACVLGATAAHAAAPRLNLVVLVDLTGSVAAKGPDGNTEFEKNVAAVGGLLAGVPPGSKVTVLGITGNSFAQPYLLLSAEVAEDPGYFGERLAAARRGLILLWRTRAARVQPRARRTDILGALLTASQLFAQTPERKRVLVIYSDMRQDTAELDLESPAAIAVNSALAQTEKRGLLADLRGVDVHVLGVDAAGRRIAYWEGLRQFWASYFKKSGATLKDFSTLRGLPRWGSE